jgi:hypothetical protein
MELDGQLEVGMAVATPFRIAVLMAVEIRAFLAVHAFC